MSDAAAIKLLSVNLPVALLERVDKEAARRSAIIGVTFTRTDAVKVLLTEALEESAHRNAEAGKRKAAR